MNWFYAQNGRQAGPVDDAEFGRLAAAGEIRPDTLVWHGGLPNWQPYAQLSPVPAGSGGGGGAAVTLAKGGGQPAGAASPYAPAAGGGVAGAAAAFAPPANQVDCSECRQAFPTDEVVRIEGLNVCARCKPILLQKLREGIRPQGAGFIYAGFWIRMLASAVDFVLLFIVSFGINMIFGAVLPGLQGTASGLIAVGVWLITSILIPLSYQSILVARTGSTLGMMACGIKVVRPDGSPLTLPRAIGRYFAKILSGLTACVGYLMAAFDEEKRALHDHICDTRVIKKEVAAL